MNLTLMDAFGRFGAKPASRLGSLSAMAADGAMVLNCLPAHFGHPARGVLRYEARLSAVIAETVKVVSTALLGLSLFLLAWEVLALPGGLGAGELRHV